MKFYIFIWLSMWAGILIYELFIRLFKSARSKLINVERLIIVLGMSAVGYWIGVFNTLNHLGVTIQ